MAQDKLEEIKVMEYLKQKAVSVWTRLRPIYTGDLCCPTQCNFCRAEVATSYEFLAILVQFASAKCQCTSIS